MWEKVKEYQRSLKEETNPNIRKDLQAIISGMVNFYVKSKTAKEKAVERYENHCKGCEHFIDETIESMIIEDKEIPELSGKSCNLCGCVESWKLRQSIKTCEFWK